MAFRAEEDPSYYEQTLTKAQYEALGGRTKYSWNSIHRRSPAPPRAIDEDRRRRQFHPPKKRPVAA